MTKPDAPKAVKEDPQQKLKESLSQTLTESFGVDADIGFKFDQTKLTITIISGAVAGYSDVDREQYISEKLTVPAKPYEVRLVTRTPGEDDSLQKSLHAAEHLGLVAAVFVLQLFGWIVFGRIGLAIAIPVSGVIFGWWLAFLAKRQVRSQDEDQRFYKDSVEEALKREQKPSYYGRAAKVPPVEPDKGKRYQRYMDILGRLQSRIGDEYADIAGKIGWLMTAQSLLFAGFVQIILNPNVDASTRFPLAVGVAIAGALIATVLAHSVFYGHAIIQVLKFARARVEAVTTQFGVPRTGIPPNTTAHLHNHLATKALPVGGLVAWIALIILAWNGELKPLPPSTSTSTPQPPGPSEPKISLGWQRLDPSPVFERGADDFRPDPKDCSDVEDGQRDICDWAQGVIASWQKRALPSSSDAIIVVGSTDRTPLNLDLRRRFEANVGLARARAESVASLLMAMTSAAPAEHRLTRDRFIVQTVGPGYTAPIGGDRREANGNPIPEDEQIREDRRVTVWIPVHRL